METDDFTGLLDDDDGGFCQPEESRMEDSLQDPPWDSPDLCLCDLSQGDDD